MLFRSHQFRWDQALGFAQWLLKDEYPGDITVWLIEGESFGLSDALSPKVQSAVEDVADRIVAEL